MARGVVRPSSKPTVSGGSSGRIGGTSMAPILPAGLGGTARARPILTSTSKDRYFRSMTDGSRIPIFDADNHMYETPDAMTKHLPGRYKGLVDYVDVHGRTKIAVKGKISDYIP